MINVVGPFHADAFGVGVEGVCDGEAGDFGEKKLLADMRRTVRIINSGKSGLSKGWHILC